MANVVEKDNRLESIVGRHVFNLRHSWITHALDRLFALGHITTTYRWSGLDVNRALVMGQILPGVPIWKLGNECRRPGLIYVVFPGNVGGDDALAQVVQKLGRGT